MPGTLANHSELVPVEKSQEILVNVYNGSAMLQQANVTQMTSNVEDVMTADFPESMWPAGMENVDELAAKPLVGDVDFSEIQIVARKMAAVKVVSDELKNDSLIDILSFYQQAIEQRFAYLIDYHALNGGGWAGTNGLINAVTALGGSHVVEETSDPRADSSAMLAAVEEAGKIPSGFLFDIRKKAAFRDQLDSTGRPIFNPSTADGSPATLHGERVDFLGGGIFRATPESLKGVVGDFQNYRIGIRSQIQADIATTGHVGTPGQPDYVNMFQDNATALRVEMRLGAVVLDAEGFAVLQQPAAA